MPYPRKGESRNNYVSRAIKEIRAEGKSQRAAVGKAEGMFDYYHGNPDRDHKMSTGNRIAAWKKRKGK